MLGSGRESRARVVQRTSAAIRTRLDRAGRSERGHMRPASLLARRIVAHSSYVLGTDRTEPASLMELLYLAKPVS